jgi:opacity protein-like surface antigen
MKRFVAVIALAAMLSSCATAAHYEKVGSGPGDNETLQRTLAKCRAQAGTVPLTNDFSPLIMSNVRENCLRAEGWVRTPACDPMWNLC